jgi:spore coat protein A, manganese oxidase
LNPLTLAPTNAKGPDYLQIGTEGGFLPNPVLVPSNVPFDREAIEGSLLLAPAERADIVVDFKGHTGQRLILYNDAPAPFPDGEESNDYFPGAPGNPTITAPGFGPNTRQIMRFKVITATSADPPLKISPTTDLTAGNDPLLVPRGVTTPPPGVPVRSLTLNETFDAYGRLIQLLGTNVPPNNRGHGFGRAYMDSATEKPSSGDIEVWQIANHSYWRQPGTARESKRHRSQNGLLICIPPRTLERTSVGPSG